MYKAALTEGSLSPNAVTSPQPSDDESVASQADDDVTQEAVNQEMGFIKSILGNGSSGGTAAGEQKTEPDEVLEANQEEAGDGEVPLDNQVPATEQSDFAKKRKGRKKTKGGQMVKFNKPSTTTEKQAATNSTLLHRKSQPRQTLKAATSNGDSEWLRIDTVQQSNQLRNRDKSSSSRSPSNSPARSKPPKWRPDRSSSPKYRHPSTEKSTEAFVRRMRAPQMVRSTSFTTTNDISWRKTKPASYVEYERGQIDEKHRAFHRVYGSPQIIRPAKIEYLDYHSSKLEDKYRELKELVKVDCTQRERNDEKLLQYTKGVMRQMKLTQSGVVPPPLRSYHRPAARGRRKISTGSARSARSDTTEMGTQTDADDTADEKVVLRYTSGQLVGKRARGRSSSSSRSRSRSRSSGSDSRSSSRERSTKRASDTESQKKSPITIDLTHDADGRHVKFRSGGEEDESSQDNADINNVEREIALQSLSDSDRRGRGKKTKSRGESWDSERSTDRSLSSSPSRRRYTSSDTSPSRSRDRAAVEHRLADTNNMDVLTWLKRKDKELRRKKREERKLKREIEKEQEEQEKERNERFAGSTDKVRAWMKKKQREYRRLLRRQRKEREFVELTQAPFARQPVKALTNVGVKGAPVNMETRASMVADGSDRKGEHDVSCQGAGKPDTPLFNQSLQEPVKRSARKRPSSARPANPWVLDPAVEAQHSDSCTCGFVEVQMQKEEELKHARLQAKQRAVQAQRARQAEKAKKEQLRPGTASVAFTAAPAMPARSASLPNIAKRPSSAGGWRSQGGKAEAGEDADRQKRLSYDQWLKGKREEGKKKRQEEKARMEELANSTDPEDKDIIQKVARKRIDNIMHGKKRIDTGIRQVDDEANQSSEERIQSNKRKQKPRARPESAPTQRPPSQDADESMDFEQEESQEKADEGESMNEKRKKSDKTKVESSQRNSRPSSARPASAKGGRQAKVKRPASAKPDRLSGGTRDGRPNRADKVHGNHSNPFKVPHPPPPRKHSPNGDGPQRPKQRPTSAYRKVKHQQQSWEDFAEHMWNDVNKEANDIYGEITVRPEPQGADNPDEIIPPAQPVSTSNENQEGNNEPSKVNEQQVPSKPEESPGIESDEDDDVDGPHKSPVSPRPVHVDDMSSTTSSDVTDLSSTNEKAGSVDESNPPSTAAQLDLLSLTIGVEPEVKSPFDEIAETVDKEINEKLEKEESYSEEHLGEPEHVEPLDLSEIQARDEAKQRALNKKISPPGSEDGKEVEKPKTNKSVRFNEQVRVEEFVDESEPYYDMDDYEDVGDETANFADEYVSLDLPSPCDILQTDQNGNPPMKHGNQTEAEQKVNAELESELQDDSTIQAPESTQQQENEMMSQRSSDENHSNENTGSSENTNLSGDIKVSQSDVASQDKTSSSPEPPVSSEELAAGAPEQYVQEASTPPCSLAYMEVKTGNEGEASAKDGSESTEEMKLKQKID